MTTGSGGRQPFLSNALIEAVRTGRPDLVAALLAAGFDQINFAEKDTGLTALHYAAALNARAALRLIVATGKCRYDLTDKRGRTAATVAVEVADDPALGRYLYDLQHRQQPRAAPQDTRDAV